jgi:predicted molibdopterin-dependent oxidoreductase YjgC
MPPGLRIAGLRRGAMVGFSLDGVAHHGHAGESLGAALLAAGVRVLRHGPEDGGPRGLFCAMGSCQECRVLVDGHVTEACRTPLAEGMFVARLG